MEESRREEKKTKDGQIDEEKALLHTVAFRSAAASFNKRKKLRALIRLAE